MIIPAIKQSNNDDDDIKPKDPVVPVTLVEHPMLAVYQDEPEWNNSLYDNDGNNFKLVYNQSEFGKPFN